LPTACQAWGSWGSGGCWAGAPSATPDQHGSAAPPACLRTRLCAPSQPTR
jgi:hypothetical protein